MSQQLRVCIDVDDLDEGIVFYTNALGLAVGRRLGKNWAELLGAPVPVDLLAADPETVPTPIAASRRDYRRHWTPVHLDWPVADLDGAVRRAQAAGAVLEGGIREKKWGRLAVLADPFGNGFCLLEFRGRGYDELVGS
jgi:catechol 2,3-dioxygenase-like lactoylglutathione lyase family enzyme